MHHFCHYLSVDLMLFPLPQTKRNRVGQVRLIQRLITDLYKEDL